MTFIALICIIGLISFRFSFGFFRFTLLLVLFLVLNKSVRETNRRGKQREKK